MITAANEISIAKVWGHAGPDFQAIAQRVQLFKQEWPAMEAEFDTAVRNRESAALARAAHKLRTLLRGLGLRCAELAEKMEHHADAADLDLAVVLLPFLKRQVSNGIRTLEHMVASGSDDAQ